MKIFVLICATSLTGCAQYVQIQNDLTEQARHGIAMLDQSSAEKDQIVQRYHAMLRKQLDDAFDQDVISRESLTADWVIESRRAYAAALNQLSKQDQASQQAIESQHRTLTATDQALQRLIWLQQLQSQRATLFQGKP